MSRGRRRVVQRAASALLIALLVAPLLLSAHRHTAREMQDQRCATCVLVRHSPAVSTAAVITVTPDLRDLVVEPEPRLPDSHRHQSPHAGRAPPSHALGSEA